MSSFDDGRDSAPDTAITRESDGDTARYGGTPYSAPKQLPPYEYQQWVLRPKPVYPIETKPFFLTSEFAGSVLAIVGIAITAASSDAFGAWRAWILITAITVGYLISRGIAKSGTRSHADDPRETFDPPWSRDQHQDGQEGS